MRLVVTGTRGLLGSRLSARARARGHDVIGLAREDLDVTRADEVRRRVGAEAPDWVAHCAAFTAVDRAEEQPEEAFALNAESAGAVARAAAAAGAHFLLPSTDFVFDGERHRPYAPDADTNPRSVYGSSKLRGELLSRSAGAPCLIARTSWLYGAGGSNFVDMVIQKSLDGVPLRIVSDQVGRPTWTGSLAEALLDLMEAGEEGTTHVADRGTASWYELASHALRVADVPGALTPVSTAEWGAPAERPAYSVLCLEDVERRLGRAMPDWRESLAHHVAERWPTRSGTAPSSEPGSEE